MESWRTQFSRYLFNWFPAYRGTGAKVTYISHDWREVRIKLPLSWRTRNYVGTIFGGSLYASIDPFYMLMLIKILGPGYVIWDKAAEIRFKKPGRSTLYASFHISLEESESIIQELQTKSSLDRTYEGALVDAKGKKHAEFKKVIYIKKKNNN